MDGYRFQWDLEGNELLSCNDKSIERLMDTEDLSIIYAECEVLELIDNYIDSEDLTDEIVSNILDIKDIVKDRIEVDAANYIVDDLL